MSKWFVRTVLVSLVVALAAPAAGTTIVGYTWDGLFRGVRNEALGGGDLAAPSGPESGLSSPATLPSDQPGAEMSFGKFDYTKDITFRNYALAVDLGPWRFQGCWTETDPMLIRTAYLPEGTGETTFQRIQTFGASYRFNRGTAGDTPRLAVGIGIRHYYSEAGDRSTSADGMDLGLIGEWPVNLANGRLTLGAACAVNNLFNPTVEFYSQEIYLPRSLRVGLAATFDTGPRGGMPGGLKLQAVYTRREDLNQLDRTDANLFGAELTLGGVLALRVGHDSYHFGGSTRLGVGIILYDPARLPVGLWAGWTRLHVHDDLSEFSSILPEHLDMFSVRLRADF